MKIVDEQLNILNKKIQRCTLCKISALDVNIKDVSLGYGKLYGWRGGAKVDFFFVGMNPSHRRFPELEYAFGGSKFDQGTGIKFVKILEDLQIKERSFIDNLCHCSTLTNSINSTQATNCFRYLLRELDLSKPSKIIAMGSKVHDILEFLLEDHDEHRQRLREIHHPNFVISYRRSLMTEYVERIRQICS